MNKTKIQKTALLGVLGAMALALSAIESFLMPDIAFLPPGAKPGLSNIVTMFTVSAVSVPAGIYIVILKAVFALITRGFTAFLMSLSGGLLSFAVMAFLIRAKKESVSLVGVGVLSALMHNMGQLLVSLIMTGTTAVFGYAPVLLLFGLLTGFVTGTILNAVMPAVQRVIGK